MSQLIPVAIGIFIKDIHSQGLSLWMQERQEEGPLNGLWEFPGGKIEAGESPKEALIREVAEEVGEDISQGPAAALFKMYPYKYRDRSIALYTFIIWWKGTGRKKKDPEREFGQDKGRWFELSYEGKSLPLQGKIPPINHQVMDDLIEYLQRHFQENLLESVWKS